jgi:ubiquinone biosynthesis protein
METQPQLLLLQKTMLVAEGVGRRLDPTVNMWNLARPLIEDWMRENRGLEARIVDAAAGAAELLELLPSLVRNLEGAVSVLVSQGLALDDEAIGALKERREAAFLMSLPLWLIALALLAIAVALW